MSRPTKIIVEKINDGYEINCIDEMTGSGMGCALPIEGYEALREHFKTGAMAVSSDEISNCNIAVVNARFSKEQSHEVRNLCRDFFLWMQENDYDHNIPIRVETKAELFLREKNVC